MTTRVPTALHLIVTLGFAGALLALGLPQTGDSILRLYAGGGDTIAADPELLDVADRWFNDPEARVLLGTEEMWRASTAVAGSPESRLLQRSLGDVANGLLRAPADARGWTVLAAARLAAGDSKGAVAALRASLLVAPYDQALGLWRCQLGFDLWRELDDGDRPLVLAQVRGAWDTQPQAVIALARQRSDFLLLMRIALFDDRLRHQDFEETFRQR